MNPIEQFFPLVLYNVVQTFQSDDVIEMVITLKIVLDLV